MESNAVAAPTEHVHKTKRRKLMDWAMSTELPVVENDKVKVDLFSDDSVNHDVAADTSGDSRDRQNVSRNSHSKKKRKSQSSIEHEAPVSENMSDIKDPWFLNTDAHQCSSSLSADGETVKKKSKKKVREIQIHNDDGVVKQEDSALNRDAHQSSSSLPADGDTGKKKSKKKVREIQIHNDDGVEKQEDSALNTDAYQCSSSRLADGETGKKKSKKKVREIQIQNGDGVEGQEDGFDVKSEVIERPHKKTKRCKNMNAKSSTEDCGLKGDDGNMSNAFEIDSSSSKPKSQRKSQVKREAIISRFMDTTLNDDEREEELKKMIEKRQEELSAINKEAYEALKRLKIVVPYIEHPSRKFETTLLKPPSKKIQMNIASVGLEMKSGKFNLEEDTILRRNWEDFAKEYGVRNPKYFLRFSNNRVNSGLSVKERIPFVKYLARDLEHRYLQSVYKRFRSLYKETEETGKFSDEEDAIIIKYVSLNIKDPHAKVALVLNRSRDAVYRRSRFLRTVNNEESDKMYEAKRIGLWGIEEKTNLIVCLLKRTNSQHVKELSSVHITPEIWAAVAEDIGIRGKIIQHFWEQRLYTQLFAKQPVWISKTCMDVLDKLNTSRVTYWQDVKWNEIAEDFPGVSGVFLWAKFKAMVKKNVPPKKWKVLRKCVKHLHKHWLPTVGSKPDKQYTRYRFRNGILVKK